MRHSRRLLSACLLAATMLTGAGLAPARAYTPYCDPYGDQQVYQACLALRASQQQQQQNQAELNRVQSEETYTEHQIVELEDLIHSLEAQIAAEEDAIAKTQAEVDALNAKIKALEADIAKRQAYIDQREQLLGQRARTVDSQGPVDYLEVLITATSFTDFLDRLGEIKAIVTSDRTLIKELQIARQQVQAERDQVAKQRDDVTALLAQEKQQEASLAATKAQQDQALQYEAQHEADLQALQAQLQADQAAINAQVQQDQQNYAAAAAAAGGGSGQFAWPEHGNFYIAQGFGCTDYAAEPWSSSCPPQAHYFHAGIDIAGPYGAPIYAADTGIVSTYMDSTGYGWHIVLTHGNGWSTLYGHLSGFNVTDGETVSRGQVIGFEGSTGNSSGPHLHFGVMLNGSWVNPCAYLVPSC